MIPCKNCGALLSGKYCSACGQKAYTEKDKSIGHLLEEGFHFLTHFEGSFFTTLKTVLRRPGKLTADYSDGIRKRYFKPVSFYLFIVVLYLVFPLARGLNMDMQYYKGLRLAGPAIERQIEKKAAQKNITEAQLGEPFLHKSHSTSKILLFLLIPLSAVLIRLLYPGRKRQAFDNLILATEINIIYLLVFYLLLPGLYYLALWVLHSNGISDEVIGLLFTLLFSLYVTLIFRNFFQSKPFTALLKGLAFGLLHAFVVLPVYKASVFEITMLLL